MCVAATLYHQGGQGVGLMGAALMVLSQTDVLLASAWLLVNDHFVCIIFYHFSGTGLATVFTTRGGRVQDSYELLCAIKPVAYPIWCVHGVESPQGKTWSGDLDLIFVKFCII